MIKHILLLIPLMSLPSATNAQQVSYSYDAAGNRVARSVSVGAPQLSGIGNTSSKTARPLQHTLSVGPNPTSGQLIVRLFMWNDTYDCHLQVSSMSGQVMIEQTMTAAEATLDISMYPNGYYLLSVDLNGEKSTYKIIKN